jgi:hypothetical protein
MLTKVKNVLDITADTVADLANVQHKTGSIQLLGFHTKGDGGGGVFFWDATKDKSEHNGGTVIDPDKAGLVANWATTQALYFTPAVIGQGCWVREYSGAVNVKWFGNSVIGLEKAFDTNLVKTDAVFLLDSPIDLTNTKAKSIVGDSYWDSLVETDVAPNTNIICTESEIFVDPTVYGVNVQDLKFKGKDSGNGVLFKLEQAVYSNYSDLFIQNYQTGFDFTNCWGARLNNVQVWDCSDYGIKFNDANNNGIGILNSHVNNCDVGIDFQGYQLKVGSTIVEKCNKGLVLNRQALGVTFDGCYFENNNTNVYITKNQRVNLLNTLFKFNNNQTVCNIDLSTGNGRPFVTIENCNIVDNAQNSVGTIFDFTNVGVGNDVPTIIYKNNYVRTLYEGSSIRFATQDGVEITPNPKYFLECDVPLLTIDQEDLVSGQDITVVEPLRFFAEKNGKMRITGLVTINSSFNSGSYSVATITLPSAFKAKTNSQFILQGVASSAVEYDLFLNVRTDATLRFSSKNTTSSLNGNTIEIDVTYSREFHPNL